MDRLKKSFLFLVLSFLFIANGYSQDNNIQFSEGPLTYRKLSEITVALVKCDPKTADDVKIGVVSNGGTSYKLTEISEFAFAGCEELKRVELPKTVKTIGFRAFYGCRNLVSVNIPDEMETIESEAFNYCTGLQKINIPANVTSIGDGAFWHNWALKNIVVDVNNKEYVDVSGVLFSKNATRLIAYPAGKTDQTYAIPANTTTIGTGAFSDCKDLVSVVLPKTLVEIRSYAFQNCARLASITLPKGIENIYSGTFSGCEELKQVVFPKKMNKIGNKAFADCAFLSNVVVPDGVELVGDSAFAGCRNVKSFSLPRTLKKIGYAAFDGCASVTAFHLFCAPPKVDDKAFPAESFEKATVYVRYYAVDAYQHSDDWVNFKFVYPERSTFRPYGLNY